MKEPILSADELTHAARALLMAVIGAPHDIECNSVTVHFDSKKPGHNALNQMSRRIEAELGALLEKLCGEPVAWMRDAGEDSLSAMSCCCTNGVKQLWLNVNPKHVERYTIPLYALNRSKA